MKGEQGTEVVIKSKSETERITATFKKMAIVQKVLVVFKGKVQVKRL